MNIQNALAGVAVTDIEASIEWYQGLLGRPPDTRPMERVAGWKFPEGGWLQIFRDADRAGSATLIFAVKSLEIQLEELAVKGIPVGSLSEPEFGVVAMISDPDGNQIVFAGPLTGVLDD